MPIGECNIVCLTVQPYISDFSSKIGAVQLWPMLRIVFPGLGLCFFFTLVTLAPEDRTASQVPIHTALPLQRSPLLQRRCPTRRANRLIYYVIDVPC